MGSRVMRCRCPYCSGKVMQFVSELSPNVCPHCFKMFAMADCRDVQPWVLGVLVVLAGALLLSL